MPKLTMFNQDGSKAGNITLSEDVFGAEVNPSIIHQVVVAQMAASRQGTQSALTRGEVRGGGIKPWRQKGTGRARQGSIRSPQWTKGGVVFAPKPRDYTKKVNKKVRAAAMKSALSMKVAEEEMIVLKDLELAAAKTKEVVKLLENLKVTGKALIVTAEKDDAVYLAARNLQGVNTGVVGGIGVYDIVNCDNLIVTEAAAKKVEEVYAQ
ncbi:MAG: 50S ribosomal protein L4 [Christensenellaceae bacterium]|jgi:large subunit ribosomal protein L4